MKLRKPSNPVRVSHYTQGIDKPDVFVFDHIRGGIACAMCKLDDAAMIRFYSYSAFIADNARQMLDHLEAHRQAGHNVPTVIDDRIRLKHPKLGEKIT